MKINYLKGRLIVNYLHRFFYLLVAFFFFQIQYTNAQQVSLPSSPLTLRIAFTEIEKQTKMSIDYNRDMIDVDKRTELLRKSGSLHDIMMDLLEGTGCTFAIQGNHIVISKVPVIAQQQGERTVTGIVTDENRDPIIGANIVEKGTNNGTISDIDGNFTLSVNNNATLHFSRSK